MASDIFGRPIDYGCPYHGREISMDVKTSGRGFEYIELPEYCNNPCKNVCLVRQSSAVGDYDDSFSRPGSSFLWIGDLHLNREQVAEFILHLSAWTKSGSLALGGDHAEVPVGVQTPDHQE